MPGPVLVLPIMTGPIFSGALGINELSISFIKIPGDTNLNFLTDIFKYLLYNSRLAELLFAKCFVL